MITKEEWKIIYSSLANELEEHKKSFDKYKTLDLANQIEKLNKLIKKVEEKL